MWIPLNYTFTQNYTKITQTFELARSSYIFCFFSCNQPFLPIFIPWWSHWRFYDRFKHTFEPIFERVVVYFCSCKSHCHAVGIGIYRFEWSVHQMTFEKIHEIHEQVFWPLQNADTDMWRAVIFNFWFLKSCKITAKLVIFIINCINILTKGTLFIRDQLSQFRVDFGDGVAGYSFSLFAKAWNLHTFYTRYYTILSVTCVAK